MEKADFPAKESEKDLPVLYTTKDISAIFGCSMKLAYEIMSSKRFPSFKLNASMYVSKIDFEKWISEQKGKTFRTH